MAKGPSGTLDRLLAEIRACRTCVENPIGAPLPHLPRPVLRVSATARIAVFGQAPGTRVHASGVPFTDPSGDRLRAWMGVTDEEFYDSSRIAIVPMGFCFPGLDAKGGDRPPRRECAPLWRVRVLAEMPKIELALLVGTHAQRWHLRDAAEATLTGTVAAWKRVGQQMLGSIRFVPMPHPSWRNNRWLAANPWFEVELLPDLRHRVRAILGPGHD